MADEYNDKDAAATETSEEKAVQEDTGATAEESHRIGEFDDLLMHVKAMESSIGSLTADVNGLKEMMTSNAALRVDNGAEVRASDPSDDIEDDIADEVIPDFKDFDLNM